MVMDHAGADTAPVARGWTLPAAAGVAALETTGLIAALALAAPRTAPLAITLLVVKYPFCLGLLHRHPGAYLGLWLWEIAGFVAATAKPGLALSTRMLELAAAALCMGLLAASASLFPSATLPQRR